MLNKNMCVQVLIDLFEKMAGIAQERPGAMYLLLHQLLPAYKATIQVKCLMVAVCYQVIRIAEDAAFPVVSRILEVLAHDDQPIVRSTIIKNFHYLAQNKCYTIFSA